jgi:hypothetical protein
MMVVMPRNNRNPVENLTKRAPPVTDRSPQIDAEVRPSHLWVRRAGERDLDR